MGKRSNFERRERDFYPTPKEAVLPLLPYLWGVSSYAEPCAGDGALVGHIPKHLARAYDIEPRADWINRLDALQIDETDLSGASHIITNPPWDRKLLHPMINHFRRLRPTWLLFDADWMHTKQSAEFMPFCQRVVSVGRVKWIADSKHTGKDNCCWYLFGDYECLTAFHGRKAYVSR